MHCNKQIRSKEGAKTNNLEQNNVFFEFQIHKSEAQKAKKNKFAS